MTTGQIVTAEQSLYADLVSEAIQIHGHDVYYLDRTLVAEDNVLGEDSLSKFNTQSLIEMYMEDSGGGYAGEQELMSQFGLQNLSEATFVVSKTRFQEKTKQIQIETGTDSTSSGSIQLESGTITESALAGEIFYILNESDATDADRPLEGDAIYHPVLKKLFEINFVDHDDPFHQLDTNPVYKLRCRLFDYGSESLDTGITAIDEIESALSLASSDYQFTLELSTYQAFGTSTLSGDGVSLVSITQGGAYTTAPTVTFSQPDIQGVVTAGRLLTYGAGHTNNAFYNMVGGSGSGLQIRGTGGGGMIGFTITVAGTGYQVGDVVSTPIDNPATLEITAVNDNTLTLGTAVIDSSGTVTEVTITEAGTGYTSTPTVTFSSSDLQGSLLLENAADTGDDEYLIQEDYIVGDGVIDKTAQNELFETLDDTVLDFSESNPFGDAGSLG
jgi:hypothetical protein